MRISPPTDPHRCPIQTIVLHNLEPAESLPARVEHRSP